MRENLHDLEALQRASERPSLPVQTGNSEEDLKARKRALKAKWERDKRLRETPEERERRLLGAKRSLENARAKETPEQKRARLDALMSKRALKRASMTEEQKLAEREYFRIKAAEKRASGKGPTPEQRKAWHVANRDRVNALKKARRDRADVKEKEAAYAAERRKSNPEKVRSATKNWIANNRDHVRAYARKKHAERYKNDPQYAVTHNLRCRMLSALKVASARKSEKTMALIGCTGAELVSHIERQFTEGMSWSNYGQWHVDHKKPCAAFNLLEPFQQQQCFHFSNLQPLWNTENWAKKDKWTEPSPDPSSE